MDVIVKGKRLFLVRCLIMTISLAALFTGGGCSGSIETSQDSEVSSITAYVQWAATTTFGTWKGWAAERLSEDTGLQVDFYPAGSQTENQLKQYMASGTLPDIIGFEGVEQAQIFIDAGLLLPLRDYEESLPSIFSGTLYDKAVTYSENYLGGESNSLLLMPVAVGWVDEDDFAYLPMLRWQSFEAVGKPVIDTLEDYLDIVEEMIKVTPISSNGEKMYGFSLSGEWDKYALADAAALGYLYGIDIVRFSPLMETDLEAKTTNSILREDSFYKKALAFYFEANQRGLLDPDSRNQTSRNQEKKYEQGQVMFAYSCEMVKMYNESASEVAGYLRQPDGYVPIVARDMMIYKVSNQTIGNNQYFGIINSSDKVNEACSFLNWYYAPETQRFLYNGPYGEYWETDDNGEPFMNRTGWEQRNGKLKEGVAAFRDMGLLGTYVMEDGYSLSYQYWDASGTHTKLDEEVNSFLGADSISDYLKDNGQIAESTIAVNMLPSIPTDVGKKISQVGNLVCSASWEMIYASDAEEFERIWETLCTQAGELGMDEIETFYQTAWKQALKRSKSYE